LETLRTKYHDYTHIYTDGSKSNDDKTGAAFFSNLVLVIGVIFDTSTRTTLSHGIIVLLLRRICAGGICTSTKRLDGQNIIITGCSAGIGKETALDLSARGAKIIMACRDTKKAEKVATFISQETGGETDVIQMDLSSLVSIREFSEQVKRKYSHIHQLINNAGIMFAPKSQTVDGFDITMGTNHLGHFYLTHLLLPLLKHSEPARIINLSSRAHWRGKMDFEDFNFEKRDYGLLTVYGTSKLANILFTRQLAKEVKDSNIQVFSLHPGAVQSELGRHMPYPIANLARNGLQLFSKSTAEGAQTSIHCATEAVQDDLLYYTDCSVGDPSPAARDDDAAQKLWKFSENVINLD
ncbi:unnamed protein product, partial [Meganyctiphanes norvegica]